MLLPSAYRKIDLSAVEHVDHILAHTRYQRGLYNDYLGIPDKNITIVPHMIDVGLVRKLGSSEKIIRRGDDEIVFFFCGGRSIEKGSYIVLRAFKKFLNRYRCVARLVLVGDPPVCKELKEVREKLVVTKSKSYHDNLRLMSSADVVLVPSQNETFGMVVLEALSLGRTIVASNTGGMREILRGGLGISVEPGDEAGLTEAMEEARERLSEEEGERYL